ncbi:MAG: chemotaxis protein CheA [Chloroflexi bacterium]|nr:chemotaxis protein CheA [Chloroflexota bacterium]
MQDSLEFTELLRAIAEDLRSLAPEDQDRLDDLGDALRDAVVIAPEEVLGLAQLLILVRSALQAPESTPEEVRVRLIEASAAALEMALQALSQPGSAAASQQVEAAAQTLEAALRSIYGSEEEESDQERPFDLLPADQDPELMGEFITECREYIQGAEAALLSLEQDPQDTEAINTVFRAFHTIKGTAAFVGVTPVSELAHHAESLLSRIRDGEVHFGGGYADLSLRAADGLKDLFQMLEDALAGQPQTKPDYFDGLLRTLAQPEAYGISGDAGSPEAGASLLADIAGGQDAPRREEEERGAADAAPEQGGRGPRRLASAEPAGEASVRVRTERLDRLIDTVGELVIAHSMVDQDKTVVAGRHFDLQRKVTHLGKIVRELQGLSMSMRMVPLKATFQKMQRLVRDLAHKSGKQVQLITEGEETEIDKNMVDVITDPLVHMIRNAVDHGIEPPDVRAQKGKPRTGTLRLRAYHAEGNVMVQIADDGKGLDRARILEKAVAKGLLESDAGVSDSELLSLIFVPGFSTAEQVTAVSGRGVGMDVVRRNVDAIGGHIDVASRPDQGSTFTLRLPLTLAVTDGMLVNVGGERYIIPTVNIYMTIRPQRYAVSTVAGRGEMVMLRGELLPLVRLHRLFGVEGAVEDPTEGLLVIVDDDARRRCALLVDALLGQQQVVAKPLSEGIGKVQGVAGAAILGDGRVGLILDTAGTAALAKQAPVPVEQEAGQLVRV